MHPSATGGAECPSVSCRGPRLLYGLLLWGWANRQKPAAPLVGCAATLPASTLLAATGLRLCGVLGRHALLATLLTTLLAVVHQLLDTLQQTGPTGGQQHICSLRDTCPYGGHDLTHDARVSTAVGVLRTVLNLAGEALSLG